MKAGGRQFSRSHGGFLARQIYRRRLQNRASILTMRAIIAQASSGIFDCRLSIVTAFIWDDDAFGRGRYLSVPISRFRLRLIDAPPKSFRAIHFGQKSDTVSGAPPTCLRVENDNFYRKTRNTHMTSVEKESHHRHLSLHRHEIRHHQ